MTARIARRVRLALARWHLRRARAHAERLIAGPWTGWSSYLIDEVIELKQQLEDEARA